MKIEKKRIEREMNRWKRKERQKKRKKGKT